MLDSVFVELSVVLGHTRMPIHQLLRMGRGAVIELNSTVEDEVLILANNVPVARGEIVIQDDQVAVSVTRMISREVMHPAAA